MINWGLVLANSIWIGGAAWILAAVSYAAYRGGRRLRANTGLYLGLGLVGAGLALSAGSGLERAVWALLGLAALGAGWQQIRAPQPGPEPPAPPPQEPEAAARAAARPPRPAIAEWLVRTELGWLALLAPFFLFPAPERVILLLGLPGLWLARRRARGRFVPRSPLDGVLVLLLVMVLVSLYATFDIGFSLGKVAGLVFGIGVYYALLEWITTRERLRWATWAYLLAGGGLAAIGLLGTNWIAKLGILGQLSAHLPTVFHGLPGAEQGFNPNEVAGALLWVVPLQLAVGVWSPTARGPGRRGAWGAYLVLVLVTILAVGTLLITQSRSALLGAAVGGGLLIWLAWPRGRLILGAGLLAGLALALYLGPQTLIQKYIDVADPQYGTAKQTLSIESRPEIWLRAIYGIEDFPVTGMGMNAFRRVRLVMYPSSNPDINIDLGHAHNHLLQAAVDLGLPGLIAYLAIWLVSGALVLATWRRAADPGTRALAAGAGAALAASFVYGMTDTVALGAKPGVCFWVLLALIVAMWRQTVTPAPGPGEAAAARELP